MNLQVREIFDYIGAADFLGVSVPSLKLLVGRKGIPHFRIGRLVKFSKKDLDLWIKKRTEQAG